MILGAFILMVTVCEGPRCRYTEVEYPDRLSCDRAARITMRNAKPHQTTTAACKPAANQWDYRR